MVKKMSNQARFLTIKELSLLLNMKESRIRFEIFRKNIPYIKIGRSIRFEYDEIIQWTKSKRQEAKNET